MKYLLLLIALLPSLANAITVSWNPPITNTDGSIIPASGDGSLTDSLVEWGTCSGTAFGTKLGEQLVPMPAKSIEFTSFTPGCYSFRVYAKNTYGSLSLASMVAQKTIIAPTPSPPTLVTIVAQIYDYQIKNGKVYLGRQVGTAPLGTACGDMVLTNYYYVPVEKVTLTRKPRSATISKCA